MSQSGPPADAKQAQAAALQELETAQRRKRAIDTQLANLEESIYRFEGSYLEETAASGGNIIKGFDNYLKPPNTNVSKKKQDVTENDRLFSTSSATYEASLEAKARIDTAERRRDELAREQALRAAYGFTFNRPSPTPALGILTPAAGSTNASFDNSSLTPITGQSHTSSENMPLTPHVIKVVGAYAPVGNGRRSARNSNENSVAATGSADLPPFRGRRSGSLTRSTSKGSARGGVSRKSSASATTPIHTRRHE